MNAAILVFLCSFSGAVYCHSQPRDDTTYIRELYSVLYSANGTELPDTIDQSTPTDIWCFSDKGIHEYTCTYTGQMQRYKQGFISAIF